MVFSSVTFIFYFLPLTIVVHYLLPYRMRIYWLCAASLVFYAWAVGYFVLVMLLVAAVTWLLANRANRLRKQTQASKGSKALTASAIVFALAILAWFKYANFTIEQYNDLVQRFGGPLVQMEPILLPAGISFFTFHAVSYAVDVYRGETEPFRNPIHYVFYLVFFPHLIAGPIVRYHEIADQIRDRVATLEKFSLGVTLFMWGLAKKVLIADSVAPLADSVFTSDPGTLSSLDVATGTLAYTIQIYFDFSGYSTMAMGLALMFGFIFPRNFDRPYSSRSITEFWRRWHMTLSQWFRDYVYVPLGGNRVGAAATYRNLLIVFLLTGIWHGANWTFIIWGLWHGLWLVIERLTGRRTRPEDPENIGGRILTLVIVMIGWVLFRSANLGQALTLYEDLLAGGFTAFSMPLLQIMSPWSLCALAIGVVSFFLPRNFDGHTRLLGTTQYRTWPQRIGGSAVLLVAFSLTLLAVVSSTYSAFLYFQF